MINELCVQPGVRHCCLEASKSRPTCFALTARCGLWPRLWIVPQYKNACKRHSTSWYTRTHTHTHYIHSIASFTQSWTHFSCYRENHQRLPYLTEILPYFFRYSRLSAHTHTHTQTHIYSVASATHARAHILASRKLLETVIRQISTRSILPGPLQVLSHQFKEWKTFHLLLSLVF